MDDILGKVGRFSAELVSAPGMTPDDTVRVAAALISSAELILKAIGGNLLAKQVFQDAVDRCITGTET